jgi:hypothetical protein
LEALRRAPGGGANGIHVSRARSPNGWELLEYRSVYEEVEFDLAKVEAKGARGEGGTAFERLESDPAKRLQACIDYETQPRFVGKELIGVNSKDVAFILILFVLAFVAPFAVVRVPTWLWEGWREAP